jgi:cephalosporin-C deacetylase
MKSVQTRSILATAAARIFLLTLVVVGPLSGFAQRGGRGAAASVQVQVTCDHSDWVYAVGEPVKFIVSLLDKQAPLGGAKITYTIGPEMMPVEKRIAVVGSDGRLVLDGGTMKEPGFLRCVVTVEQGGGSSRGLATAGFSPEKIRPTQTEPADFDAFWDKAKEELAMLSLDPKLTPLPELTTDRVEVFQVSLQNIGVAPARSSRFYGVLCVPRGEGPFPAMMIPPGAGIKKFTGDPEDSERGFITLTIGIHGIPVTLPDELYTSLNGALGRYSSMNLEDRDRFYFRRVFMGCLRANDYLASLPKWDHKNLVMWGGSQGGYLSMVTTALDPRVTACVAAFPAFCDVTGYLHGRAGGWPRLVFDDPKEPGRAEKIATTAFYDAVNFAKRIKVPGHYGWGFNDETCPPTSTYSAYNSITAPKTLLIAKEMGHGRAHPTSVPQLTPGEREWLFKEGMRQ